MAEFRTVTVIPLKGANYPTWNIQCRMALMKEGLWRIVTGEETAPGAGTEAERAKFTTRKDRALAMIVLSVDPSLLYLVGDPEDPVAVWKKLGDQFQKDMGDETRLATQTARRATEGRRLCSRAHKTDD